MLRFKWGKGPQVSQERLKQQRDLFAFNKTVPHGFPYKANALAYDPILSLLAIGTKQGLLRIYGAPGVEFHGLINSDVEVQQILFLEGRGQLITLCNDSSLQFWELNDTKVENDGVESTYTTLEKVKECDYFSKEEATLKQITVCNLSLASNILLVGTQSGNVYMVDLDTFDLTNQIIYQDVVLQNLPEELKAKNPGEVEALLEKPNEPSKLLIGYTRGLMVLWDNKNLTADQFYSPNQQLESLCWLSNGEQFVSSHNDGSYIIWRVKDHLKPSEPPKTPYGPFPCKAISKLAYKTVENGDDLVIFAGGMQRASYGEKNTVSIIAGAPESGKHHVLDFTSKVVDFAVIQSPNSSGSDNPLALIVLVEEELVVVDLRHPDWLPFKLPYLWSVHSSAITCCQHYSDVPLDIYKSIIEAGARQSQGKTTSSPWPITGGRAIEPSSSDVRDLLITGHEDGSVRFWNVASSFMSHVYTLHTSKYFISMDEDIAPIDGDERVAEDNEDEWPPFKKVGTFDPYSDDPRLAIRKILLSGKKGLLVVAGTAGQVIVLSLKNEPEEKALQSTSMGIVGDKDGNCFVWKGHEKLSLKNGLIKLEAGFQPQHIVQLVPPAAVTAINAEPEWGLVAAGTAHGFGLFDFIQGKVVITRCSLNPSDLFAAAGGDAIISRRKSFKKSLRESFRRIRKGRSTRSGKKSATPEPSSPAKSLDSEGRKSPRADLDELKPVERGVEASPRDDSMGSMIRCFHFDEAILANGQPPMPSFWCGTNAGLVYVYTVTLPEADKRQDDPVTVMLGKEIQLRHRAPVVYINLIDHNGNPSVEPNSEAPKSLQGPQRVLICSEEQFKLFSLPAIKPICKFKLTAHEGSRVRRILIAKFVAKSNEKTTEHGLVYSTNQGDLNIQSLIDLKRQLNTSCIRREDINGISSVVFTDNGEGFYLHSPCEFQRFSLSARRFVKSLPLVAIPANARPIKIVEKVAEAEVTAAAASVPSGEENAPAEEPCSQENETQKSKESEQPQSVQIEVTEPEPETNNDAPANQQIEEAEEAEEAEEIEAEDDRTSGIGESEAGPNDGGVANVNGVVNGLMEDQEDVHEDGLNNEESCDGHPRVNGVQLNGDGDQTPRNSPESEDIDDSRVNLDDTLTSTITMDSVRDHMANLNINNTTNVAPSELKKPSPTPLDNRDHENAIESSGDRTHEQGNDE